MAKIFVGIVIYENSIFQIERLIRSIAYQSDCNDSVTIQFRANDSRDYTESLNAIAKNIKSCNNIQIASPISGKNIGFGAAHNNLASIALSAGADLYLGLNPDGMLHHRAIHELLLAWSAAPSDTLLELRQFPEEHPKVYDCVTGETAWCSGAAFAMAPNRFIDLGGFDERLFMYCEDVDLSWRVRASGGHCRVAYSSLFLHDLSDGRTSTKTRIQMLRSGRFLGWKWRIGELERSCDEQMRTLGFHDPTASDLSDETWRVGYERSVIDRVCKHRSAFDFSVMRW
ncbi:hypothetical protein [Methylobacterium aerolatum]|uniref:GT2 family glycosyltransferase n=1 Tax=Methylobacterium aerolatum TaxID=418708 RepID=A0ABU0HV56_9HYPH|nr:hypothetical protein [Methylobacterium aerolatum]MDQ0446211.1 GT2 family glycosyltransferase [Methylobacterium aerolatum]GJD35553.1 hypothetical protein FMGBMHLM_2465 [Methylobacterium aerolatum]